MLRDGFVTPINRLEYLGRAGDIKDSKIVIVNGNDYHVTYILNKETGTLHILVSEYRVENLKKIVFSVLFKKIDSIITHEFYSLEYYHDLKTNDREDRYKQQYEKFPKKFNASYTRILNSYDEIIKEIINKINNQEN